MKAKLVSRPGETRIWVAVLDSGEEVNSALISLARREQFAAASFVALGAFEKAVVGYFDWQRKTYQPIPIAEQVEVISLVGDIIPDEKGEPSLHAHTVLGRFDGSTRGGHLLEATVRPTLEVTVTETAAHLTRRKHPELGIALIDID